MKNRYLIVLGMLLCMAADAQNGKQPISLVFDAYMYSGSGHLMDNSWVINSREVKATADTVILYTHFPAWDTLIFRAPFFERVDTILTRFKPGAVYSIGIGCCDEGFDIADMDHKHKHALLYAAVPEEQHDSLTVTLWENAEIRFRLKNYRQKDTLWGIYGDFATVMVMHPLANNRTTPYYRPNKGFYATNTDYVILGYPVKGTPVSVLDGMRYWEYYESNTLQQLKSVQVRFFYNEKVLVIYDARRNRWQMLIE